MQTNSDAISWAFSGAFYVKRLPDVHYLTMSPYAQRSKRKAFCPPKVLAPAARAATDAKLPRSQQIQAPDRHQDVINKASNTAGQLATVASKQLLNQLVHKPGQSLTAGFKRKTLHQVLQQTTSAAAHAASFSEVQELAHEEQAPPAVNSKRLKANQQRALTVPADMLPDLRGSTAAAADAATSHPSSSGAVMLQQAKVDAPSSRQEDEQLDIIMPDQQQIPSEADGTASGPPASADVHLPTTGIIIPGATAQQGNEEQRTSQQLQLPASDAKHTVAQQLQEAAECALSGPTAEPAAAEPAGIITQRLPSILQHHLAASLLDDDDSINITALTGGLLLPAACSRLQPIMHCYVCISSDASHARRNAHCM